MNSVDLRNNLRKKLTKRQGGEEAFSAILTGISLLTLCFAATLVDGWVLAGVIYMIAMNLLGILLKIAGWRSVTLNNDEQEFLARNYNL